MRLPHKYHLKIGYDYLLQNIILKGLLNIKGTTITDLDIELKMKISKGNYLENRLV